MRAEKAGKCMRAERAGEVYYSRLAERAFIVNECRYNFGRRKELGSA
jgi:hypothetical protein